MNPDPAKLSLSDFLAAETNDPLQPPAAFTNWMRATTFATELYEPEMVASPDARTTINYNGKQRSVINLCSYNYLGLANHPEVIAAAHEALTTHGLGACGSPMLSGMTDLHRELERRIAKFLNREDAMLFNSGFGGALGTISGLLRKTDAAILDNRSHLSLRDGAILSRCRADKFEHNDPASLDKALSRKQGRRQLVVVEGIYSMDGDFGNLKELADVAESHKASLFVDEAHSMLACGENGRGAAEKFGVEDRVPLIYGTFSKAFGALGGFVAGSKETLRYLRFYAHPYVYSCALPPVVVAAIIKALEIGIREPELRTKALGERRVFSCAVAQSRHRYRNIDNLHHADRDRRSRTHVSSGSRAAPARALGCSSRLSGGAAGQDLLPRLRHRETYARRSRRSAQHSQRHAQRGLQDKGGCLPDTLQGI